VSRPFEDATALTREGAMRFAAEIDPAWSVGRGPNGGYVTMLLLRALMETVASTAPDERIPRSLTIHFVAPPRAGPCHIETRVERSGRTLTTLTARLTQPLPQVSQASTSAPSAPSAQGERLCALALASFFTPAADAGLTLREDDAPRVPPPEDCPPFRGPDDGALPFTQHYDYRWAIGDPPLSGSAHARVGGWIRLAEPRLADALLVAAFTDAWVPSVYPRLAQPLATPTIDLTIHFRTRLPLAGAQTDDFYFGVYSSRLGAEGFFEEDSEVWSRDGQLLAQSRQLALLA
jgi:acyl-CoA thioesterase